MAMMEKSSHRLASLFNIRPGEERLVSLLVLHNFFLGMASVFTQTISFALFLANFGSQQLSYAYMAIAVGASLAAFIYLKVGERLSFARLIVVNLASLALISVAMCVGLAQAWSRWLTFFLPMWFQILANLSILAVWTLAVRLFDMRQGKRLFGLVGAGNWAAIAAGGFLVTPIVALLGIQNLLLLAAISLAIGIGFQLVILREFGASLKAPPQAAAPASKVQQASRGLLQNRYVVLILVLVVLWWVGFFFVDNIFYDVAASRFPDANQLASALGTLFAADGVLGLLTATFLAGPIISRYGVRVGLMILPAILAAGVGGLAVAGGLGVSVAILFWLAALSKISSISFGFSIDQSSRAILYQPLPADQRGRIQTLAEAVAQPIATGLAGILLLIFNTLLAFGAVRLSFLFLIVAVSWIAVVISLMRQYPVALAHALAKRRLGESPLELGDRVSVAVLKHELHSPHPGAVIYALNMLEQAEPGSLAECLPDLLAHASPEVRQAALERIERMGMTGALPLIHQRLEVETSARVRGAALRALTALNAPDMFELASAHLDDPDAEVRRGAMIGLLRNGGLEGTLAAGQKLIDMTTSPRAAERALAAQVLGQVGIHHYYQPLAKLLDDDDPRVRRAALRSAGQLKHPHLWPQVMEAFCTPGVRSAAMSALVAGGESVLPDIRAAFVRDQNDCGTLVRLAQVCGRIGGEGAVAFLKDRLNHCDPDVRIQVMRSLSRCGYRAQSGETTAVQKQIGSELEQAAWLAAASADLGEDEPLMLLRSAMDDQLAQCRERAFFLLSFVYDALTILRARDNLKHASVEKRAYALEVLDVTIAPEVKRLALPLIEDLTPQERLRRLSDQFPQPRLSRDQRLQEIASSHERLTAWTKTCAEYAQIKLSPSMKGECGMLSTIEKVLILKSVNIFDETPDEILADVAQVCEDVEFKSGDKIFEKGDAGNSLYIIISGQVRVHDGEHTLNFLGERDVFGEMALLDPEPRVASVTAVEDTRMLRLDQEPFFELMEDRIEVARGIIKVLSRRLRARVQDLNQLRARVEGATA